jgi:PilZ domain
MTSREPLDLLVADPRSGQADDVRDEKCIYVSIPGRYALVGSKNSRGEPRQFRCRAVSLSAGEIAVAAPVIPKKGVRVIADIDQLGRLNGTTVRVFERGFAINVEAGNPEREMLAIKIGWIERYRDFAIRDKRTHARFIPRRPLSFLTLADGSILSCFVIDVSVSGAAVSADVTLAIGTVLAVGHVVGRVVRFIPGGFAVRFVDLENRQEVEARVIRR